MQHQNIVKIVVNMLIEDLILHFVLIDLESVAKFAFWVTFPVLASLKYQSVDIQDFNLMSTQCTRL